jgi:3-dehydroquinate synthase
MLAAAHLSEARGLMAPADAARLRELIARLGPLPAVNDLSARAALAIIRRDKKVVAGRLHFVLANGIGDTAIAGDVTARELTSAMRAIGLRA